MNPVLQKKLSILIRLAAIDGEFAKSEKEYIFEICKQNDVSNRECEQLIDNPDDIGSLGALSYNKVVEYMSDFLSLILADGVIRQSEVILCEDIGLRLGFTKAAIDQVIEHLKHNLNLSGQGITRMIESLDHPGKISK